jgi:DNA-binding MarR family transcriptional regulator
MSIHYNAVMKEIHGAANPNDIEDQLIESSGFLLAAIGQESRRQWMEHVSRWDLGWPHQSVLGALLTLGDEGAASQKRLSEFVGIDPRNLVALLDVLEQRRLVERIAKPRDRRTSGVKLTEAGASLARELRAAAVELERRFFASLSQDEQHTLHQLLLKLYRGVEDDHAEE